MITLILAALHAYVGVRLLAPFDGVTRTIGIGVLIACFWLLPKGWRARKGRSPASVMLPWITMGFFSWLLVLTVVRDLSVAIGAVLLPPETVDAWIPISAAAVMALVPAITAIGYFMARRVAAVVEVDVPLADLPLELEGFTIAQITDIHVGPTIKREFVEAVVARVNTLGADMVAITGDLVDGSVRELAHHTEPLSRLESRHGTYVVTGNHEYYSGAHAWIHERRRLGARVLLNDHAVLEHDGAKAAVAGVTDYSAHFFDESHRSDPHAALQRAPVGAPRILLAHQPRSAHTAAAAGYHLQLSGHTHGGQFWPGNLFVRLSQPFTGGAHPPGAALSHTSPAP